MEQKHPEDYKEFTDEELASEFKKQKLDNTIKAFIIGLLAGIAVYSIVKNGLGFLTFLLLFLLVKLFNKKTSYKEIETEIKNRKSTKDFTY